MGAARIGFGILTTILLGLFAFGVVMLAFTPDGPDMSILFVAFGTPVSLVLALLFGWAWWRAVRQPPVPFPAQLGIAFVGGIYVGGATILILQGILPTVAKAQPLLLPYALLISPIAFQQGAASAAVVVGSGVVTAALVWLVRRERASRQ